MFWNKYPYTDFHELNLDMILKLMKELHAEWDEFTAVNKITNAGAWDITKQYQAWTIVSDNNVGYISLKPVPVGIAITNTEYWGVIADYDILITDLSDRISALEYANQKKYIFIADSYGGLGWTSDVVNRLDLDARILNVGGAGFAAAGGGDTWEDALTALAGSMTADERKDITDIIIGGGVNDYSFTKAQIKTAIRSFITFATGAFPRAKMGVACISWMNRSNDVSTYISRVIPAYQEEFESYGNTYYIPNAYLPMHNYENIQADGIHPTASGVAAITNFMCNYILKGSADYVVCTSPTVTNVNCSGAMRFNTVMSAAGVDITFSGATIVLDSPKTFNSFSNLTHIARLSGGCAMGLVANDMDVTGLPSITIPINCTLVTTDSKQYSETILLSIYNGYVDISGAIQDTTGLVPIAYATGNTMVLSPITHHVSLLSS